MNDGAIGLLYGGLTGLTGSGSAIWTNLTFGLDPTEAPQLGYGLEAG